MTTKINNTPTNNEILSLAYDVNAMPEQMTNESLCRFARALLSRYAQQGADKVDADVWFDEFLALARDVAIANRAFARETTTAQQKLAADTAIALQNHARLRVQPTSAQPVVDRDWELRCETCDGAGYVYRDHQVAERDTDIQTFKEECECCEGRGFTFAYKDIPGIEEYVKRAPQPTSAQDDPRTETPRKLTIQSKEHYDMMAQFEQTFKGRFDREDKQFWSIGSIYQDGKINDLFKAYKTGYALGISMQQGGRS